MVFGEDVGCQFGFVFLQCENFFFDVVVDDQFVDEYWFVLIKVVGVVGCLIFDGWILLWVVMDDGIGGSQVEVDVVSFQIDQEDWYIFFLEVVDWCFLMYGVVGECYIGQIEFVQFVFDQCQYVGEL